MPYVETPRFRGTILLSRSSSELRWSADHLSGQRVSYIRSVHRSISEGLIGALQDNAIESLHTGIHAEACLATVAVLCRALNSSPFLKVLG